MRKRELIKAKKKKTKEKYSDFELQEFLEEIKDYSNLLNSIGYKINKTDIKCENLEKQNS